MKTKNRLLCLALVLTMLLAVAPAAAADSKDSAAVPQQMYTRHGMIGNENPHTQTDVDFPMLEMMLNRYAFFNFYCDEACTVRIEVDMITSSNPDVAEVVINSGNSAVHMKAFGTTILSAEMDGVVYQMEFSVVPQTTLIISSLFLKTLPMLHRKSISKSESRQITILSMPVSKLPWIMLSRFPDPKVMMPM